MPIRPGPRGWGKSCGAPTFGTPIGTSTGAPAAPTGAPSTPAAGAPTAPITYDPLHQPFASNRYCITAKNGVVATGSNLASQAGLSVLQKGGNAVDAAIATAACLTVVEPTANGLGSDCFAIVSIEDKLYGLNASGAAPKGISIEKLAEAGVTGKMPTHGWTPVTVPGAVGGWVALHERFGKLPLADVLAPAIAYAEHGYPLSPMLAAMFGRATEKFGQSLQGRQFDEWFRVFTKDRAPYAFGEMIRLPDHAKTLRLIAQTKGEAFYRGEIAAQMAAQSVRDGGYLAAEDLAAYAPLWVDPISVDYRGYQVWEIPPNGQGIVALMALNIRASWWKATA